MRQVIFMFFFIMYAQILLLFKSWYNNIFGPSEQPPTKPLVLSI